MARRSKQGEVWLGSSMSSKQIAYASVHGRQVTFKLTTGDQVTGFVCGADDYHWFVATVVARPVLGTGPDPDREPQEPKITKYLVHKAGAVLLILVDDPEGSLDSLDPTTRVAIEELGRAFWGLCARVYFNLDLNDPAKETSP